MDAMLQIARFGSWRLASSDTGQLLWALGNARHWTARLPDIEACLVKVSGM